MGSSQARWGYGVIGALVAGAAAVFAIALSSPASASAADKDCADFDNQKQAQRFFKRHKPRKDRHNLDADSDGIACESNPCPCRRKPAFRAKRVVARTSFVRCGSQDTEGAGWFNAQAHNVGCKNARAIAHRYTWGGDNSPQGYRCNRRRIATEIWKVRCWRGKSKAERKIVKFKFGA